LPANKLLEWYREHRQDKRLTRFNAAATAVSNELEAAFRGNQGAVRGIMEWRKSMNPAMSNEQMQESNRTLVKLLEGQLDSVTEQHRRAFGSSRPAPDYLNPKARAVFERISEGKAPTDEGKQLAPSVPSRPSAVPSGSQYSPSRKQSRTPDGKILDAQGNPVQ